MRKTDTYQDCNNFVYELNKSNHIYIFRDFIHLSRKPDIKNFKIKNKDNKISHGRENFLRNKVTTIWKIVSAL